MTPDITPPEGFKFPNVSCSQCGQDFGPGDHGFSHCSDHNAPPDSGQKGRETGTPRMTEDRIAQIEKEANQATVGPWKIWGMQVMSDPKNTYNVADCEVVAHTADPHRGLRTFNATFICTARTAVPELISEVRFLNDELAAKDALIGDLQREMVRYLPVLEWLEGSDHWQEATKGLGIATANGYRNQALRRAEQGKEGDTV